jgi:hypothetical protein
MRFISLSTLKKVTSSIGDPISDRKKILDEIHAVPSCFETSGYSNTEIQAILAALNEQTEVFFQWIEQDKGLLSILEGKHPKQPFSDHFHWIGHALSEDFGRFLSPFLCSAALKFRDEKNATLLFHLFSYFQLLPADDRLVIEQEIFKGTKERIISAIQETQATKTEEQLLQLTEDICSNDLIGLVGQLSRSSYHTKVWYVDQILTIFKHPDCSARLAFRIVQRLKELELNPEHQTTINEIEKDLTTGQILANKKGSKKNVRITGKKIFSIVFLIGLALAVYFIVNYKEPQEINPDLDLASSFEKFSKEERKQIDSLLRSQRQDSLFTENDQDQYLWTQGNGVSLSLRKPLKNERMEELYNDWLLDAQLYEKGIMDTCLGSSGSDKFQYKGVKSTDQLKGDRVTTIRNESEYSVYIFVFEEKKNGSVYSTLLKKNKTISLNLNTDQYLLFVAGNTLAEFKKPSGAGIGELPSKSFDHHFCETDFNLSISMNTIYKLAFPQKGSNKLLLSGDEFSNFVVADLYGILETY